MYDLLEPAMDPGTGLSFSTISVVATNRAGSTKVAGDCVSFCFADPSAITGDGVTASSEPGAEGYYLANFQGLGTGDQRCQYYGIVDETIADQAKGRVIVKGLCQAKVIDNSGATSIGAGLGCVVIAANVGYLDARGGANSATISRRIVAITAEDYSASSITPTSIRGIYVVFDGLNGFGGTAL